MFLKDGVFLEDWRYLETQDSNSQMHVNQVTQDTKFSGGIKPFQLLPHSWITMVKLILHAASPEEFALFHIFKT